MVDSIANPNAAKALSKPSPSEDKTEVSSFDKMIYQAAGVTPGKPVSFTEGLVGKLFAAWLKSKGLQPGSVTVEHLQQFANQLKNSKVAGAQKYFEPIINNILAVVNELKMSRGVSDTSFLKGANSLIDSLGKLKEAGLDLKVAGLDKLLEGTKNLIGEYNSKKKALEERKANPVEFAKLDSWFRSQSASLKIQFFSNPDDPSAKAQTGVIQSEASYQLGLDLTLEQAADHTRVTKGAGDVSKTNLQRKAGESFEDYRFRLSKTFGVPLNEIPDRKAGETDSAFDARIVDAVFKFIQNNSNSKFLVGLLDERTAIEQKILMIESKLKSNPKDEAAKLELTHYQGRLKIINDSISKMQESSMQSQQPDFGVMMNSTVDLLNNNLATLNELYNRAKAAGDAKLMDQITKRQSALTEAIKSVKQFFVDAMEKYAEVISQAARAA